MKTIWSQGPQEQAHKKENVLPGAIIEHFAEWGFDRCGNDCRASNNAWESFWKAPGDYTEWEKHIIATIKQTNQPKLPNVL